MSKFYLSMVFMLASVCAVMAVPAPKKAVRMQQPDGSYVTICLHGDEHLHFNTTDDGYSVVKDHRGYYVYAALENGQLVPTVQVAHEAVSRTAEEKAYLQGIQKYMAPEMTRLAAEEKKAEEARRAKAQARAARYDYNSFKGLIILIQFNDMSFSRSDYKDIITDMVNQENYTGFDNQNYTGSVRDYFSDNSGGKFQPQFDIVGPYTVNYSQFDGGNRSMQIINAALNAADNDIDFKDYDGDNDGVVDMVYFIVAGNGANYGGNDERLWWPHRSIIYNPNSYSYIYKDGVMLYDYASSVELAGYTYYPSTVKIDGIGTICHEFSHVLGLPDLYDTDYEGSGGESHDPGGWSVMAGGSYNNDGRTPVGYSLYERYLAGFIDDIPTITEDGHYTLNPLYSSEMGYRINTQVDNEFFLFENRQKNMFKWDAYLPGSGMLVHRVDHTNSSVWDRNEINCNPKHNYYEVVRAGGWRNGPNAADVFPGTLNVKTLNNTTSPANLLTWGGKETLLGLENITNTNGVISFDIIDASELRSISLPENAIIGVGATYQLEAIRVPDYAPYTFKWTSSNTAVATVNHEGLVTGMSAGTATITLTANETLTATCQVTVEAIEEADNINAFTSLTEGDERLLHLNNAQVLFANDDYVYVRDASGVLVFQETGVSANQNDILNGTIYGKYAVVDKLPYLQPVEGYTNGNGLTSTPGSEAIAREVVIDKLTDADYADLVTLKGGKFERINNVVYLVGEQKQVRAYNRFEISGVRMPIGYIGKYYNVTGILLTYQENGEVVDELAILRSPVEGGPTAIDNIKMDAQAEIAVYTVDGKFVTNTTLQDLKSLPLKQGIYIVKSDKEAWKVVINN